MKETGLLQKILDKLQAAGKDSDGKSELSDNELIQRFVDNNDAAAFEMIVSRYMEKIYSLAYRITRDHYKSEDVMQEVYMGIIAKNVC
ncbi:MAG TPA: sigma factor [Thermodesulfobacteriota bacterium]|jgi:hypothetical protein|nr:sigma factor [Thermodesulfobacteriota bacterium]